jgi:hypothetical protein
VDLAVEHRRLFASHNLARDFENDDIALEIIRKLHLCLPLFCPVHSIRCASSAGGGVESPAVSTALPTRRGNATRSKYPVDREKQAVFGVAANP